MNDHVPNRMRGNILLTITAAVWGFAFVAQRVGAEHVNAFTFNSVRFALGGLSLFPIVWWLDRRAGIHAAAKRELTGSAFVPGLIAGAFLFGGSALQQLGVEQTTAGKASFITGLYIVIVPLIGLVIGHKVLRSTWLGIVLAVAGLYLLTVTGGLSISVGDGLVLLGTLFWAGHIISIGKFGREQDAIRLSIVQFLACSAYSGVAALFLDPHPFTGMDRAVIPLLYGGLMSTGVAYTLQVVGQKDALPTVAAMIMSTESAFGAIGGALMLGEQMTPRGYLGCALMMAGILISQWEPREQATTPPPGPEPPAHL